MGDSPQNGVDVPIDDLDIAVVGIGCRFPGAEGPEQYWRNLAAGTESIRTLSVEELRAAGVDAAEYNDPAYVRAAGVLDHVDRFDAGFFGYSPKEAEILDPQIRLFLECAWEAFEDAGYDPGSIGAPVGLFVAASPSTYIGSNLRGHFDPSRFTLAPGNFQHYIATASDFLGTRVSYKLNLRGPSLTVQTACSGSLVAVHLARQSLLSGESSVALAGAVSIFLPQTVGYLYREGLILSPDGHCRPFDAAAAGTVFGRGAGVLVLKRLSDAIAAGDRIYAVIKGSAINNDGANKVGFTAPSVSGQAEVIAEALANAGVSPDAVSYVETHGTATPHGDPIEIAGLTAAFRGGTTRTQFCAIGSVKGNIGHLDAAAGMAGLIKTVLALDREQLPPTLHYTRPNPAIDFAQTPFYVNDSLRAWRRSSQPRRAGVSAFGVGGTNAHVVLEEAPAVRRDAPADPRPQHLFTLSAKSAEALTELAARCASAVGSAPLADLCFTASAGRAQLPHRAAIVTGNPAQLATQLHALAAGETPAGVVHGEARAQERPRVALLFTGQGAQYAGMARELYRVQPTFRAALDACADRLAGELPRPLLDVLFETPAAGSAATIDQTIYAQPALVAVEYALATLWRAWGIEADAVLGHSVGEYAAACVAGAVSLEDALRLVAARGRLLQALPAGGTMAAVLAGEQAVRAAIGSERNVAVAAVNAPDAVAIAGVADAVAAVCSRLQAQGIETQDLSVSHAFHSPLVDPMLDAWTDAVRRVRWQAPQTTIASSVTGAVLTSAELREVTYWRRQVREPVQFAAGLSTLAAQGCNVFLEVGPQPTLIGLGRRTVTDTRAWWGASLRRSRPDWEQLLETLGRLWVRGVRIDWSAVWRDYPGRRVALPTYPFQRTRHWVEPVRQVAAGAAPHETRTSRAWAGRLLASPVLRDRVVEISLAADRPAFLDDHRIAGGVVVPMTAFVEMMLTAGGVEPARSLRDLRLTRAMPLAGGASTLVQVVSRDGTAGERLVEIYSAAVPPQTAERSASETAQPSWLLHATATLAPRADADAGQRIEGALDLHAVLARCTSEVPAGTYYDELREDGLEYGAAFRGIDALWRGTGEVLARLTATDGVQASAGEYAAHPALVDAAVQAVYAAFPSGLKSRDSVFVPAAARRVSMHAPVHSACWSHITVSAGADDASVQATVRIADEQGAVLMELDGLVFQRAPRALFGEARRDLSGDLYTMTWQPADLAPADASDGTAWPPRPASVTPSEETVDEVRAAHGVSVYDQLGPQLDRLSAEYISEAVRQLGALPAAVRFTTNDAAGRLGVLPRYHRMLARMLEILAEEGCVDRDGDGWVAGRLVEAGDLDRRAAELLAAFPACRAEIAVTSRCGRELAAVLRGDQDPLELLFPGGSLADLEALYTNAPYTRACNTLVQRTIAAMVRRLPADRPVRMLEIGSGTGGTASWVVPALPPGRARYTFTDVSPLFTSRAQQRFAAYPWVDYRLLDIDRDPVSQGFEPGTYDVVLATNVLHATADMRQTMTRVQRLLAPGGLVVMVEAVAPQRWIDVIFGLTDGWWRFADTGLRPSYPLLDPPRWQRLLREVGFEEVTFAPGGERASTLFHQSLIVASAPAAPRDAASGVPGHWLIVPDRSGVAEKLAGAVAARGDRCAVLALDDHGPNAVRAAVAAVHPEPGAAPRVVYLRGIDMRAEDAGDEDVLPAQREGLQGAVSLTQALLSSPAWQSARLSIVTRGGQAVGDTAVQVGQAPLWGFGRSVALEHPELACRRIDLDPDRDVDVERLMAAILEPGGEDEVALRGGGRLVSRLTPLSRADGVHDSNGRASAVSIATPGMLDTLARVAADRRPPAPGEVEIEVSAAGLNFKDVLRALGTLPGAESLGLECAGRITRVGEGVTAFAPGDRVTAMVPGTLRAFVTTSSHYVVRTPPSLSDDEAAIVPVAFVTAAYALEQVAQLKRGERVLIHAATGGVGMAAIQIARRAGAEILATAGNDDKRAWLRAHGVEHVMDSRSLTFAAEVRALTGGRGVDVILNSLAGEFVSAGLTALAPGGRFVELGKAGITAEDAARLRPDAVYLALDVGDAFDRDPATLRALLERVMADYASGAFEPLPRQVFAAADASSAFRLMSQARHLGKLAVRFNAGARPTTGARIRPDGTYLVTGAFGGIGALVARWLVERGARALLLMGRTAPDASGQALIADLEGAGAQVVVSAGDVASVDAVRRALTAAEALPPLAGVFHAAGVVDDRMLVQQEWRRFEHVLAAKVQGSWNLHRLTREMPLDCFVLFSTSMALLGSAGQSNHTAANTYMDTLAACRRQQGLPALSINWGPWSGVGAAVTLNVTERFARQGVLAIAPQEGMATLESLVCGDAARGHDQVAVMPMLWPLYLRQSPARHLGRFSAIDVREPHASPAAAERSARPAGADLIQRLADAPVLERPNVLREFVREQIARSLGLPASAAIEPDRPFADLGLDSLLAVEVRSVLGTAIGRPLPAAVLFDHPSLDAVTTYLGKDVLVLEPWSAAAAPVEETVTPDAIEAIEQLDDEEVERLLAARLLRGVT